MVALGRERHRPQLGPYGKPKRLGLQVISLFQRLHQQNTINTEKPPSPMCECGVRRCSFQRANSSRIADAISARLDFRVIQFTKTA